MEFGTFSSVKTEPDYEFSVRFKPFDLISRWQRCGLTADFFSNFESMRFKSQETAKNVISTIINEMVENAVKYSVDKHKPVKLTVKQIGNDFLIEAVNTCDKSDATEMEKYSQKLFSSDLDKLFQTQIEAAATGNSPSSQIGLLTIKKDFPTDIGIRITPKDDDDIYEIAIIIKIDKEAMDKL